MVTSLQMDILWHRMRLLGWCLRSSVTITITWSPDYWAPPPVSTHQEHFIHTLLLHSHCLQFAVRNKHCNVLLTWLTYHCLPLVPVFRFPFSTGLHHSCAPPSPRSIVPTGSPGIGNRTCYTQMRLSWTLQFLAHSPGLCTLLHSTVCHQSIKLLLFALDSVSRVNNTYSFNQE